MLHSGTVIAVLIGGRHITTHDLYSDFEEFREHVKKNYSRYVDKIERFMFIYSKQNLTQCTVSEAIEIFNLKG